MEFTIYKAKIDGRAFNKSVFNQLKEPGYFEHTIGDYHQRFMSWLTPESDIFGFVLDGNSKWFITATEGKIWRFHEGSMYFPNFGDLRHWKKEELLYYEFKDAFHGVKLKCDSAEQIFV